MKKIIVLATQLATPVTAAFTEEQLTALRVRVLPLFDFFEQEDTRTYPYLGKNATGPSKQVLMPAGNFEKVRKGFNTLKMVYRMVNAVAGKGSPASKAYAIKTIKNDMQRTSKTALQNMAEDAVVAAKTCLKYADWLTPEAVDFLKAFSRSPTTKLLVASWSYIAAEIVKEGKAITKKNGLMEIPQPLTKAASKAVIKRVQDILVSQGFKKGIVDPNASNASQLPRGYATYVKGGLAFMLDPESGVYPVCVINNYAYTDERYGVDSGWKAIPYYDKAATVEGWVEKLLAELERKEERVKHSSKQASFELAPGLALKLDDAQKQRIRDDLRTTGVWTYTPSGFGTGYTFRANGTGKPASKALVDLVGKPVTYTTFDAD